VDPTRPVDKRNAAARGLWQEMSTARAFGKWNGLLFATPHTTSLNLAGAADETAGKPALTADDAAIVPAAGDSVNLEHVSSALTFVTDCVLADCGASEPALCRSQLAGLQHLRPALLAVVAAPASEAELRASVGNVADLVDGMVVGCPAEFPEAGGAVAYYNALNGELLPLHRGSPHLAVLFVCLSAA
jgi:hypothetical protein